MNHSPPKKLIALHQVIFFSFIIVQMIREFMAFTSVQSRVSGEVVSTYNITKTMQVDNMNMFSEEEGLRKVTNLIMKQR